MNDRQCNYCSYQELKKMAEKANLSTTLIEDTMGGVFPDGKAVYTHPPEVDISQMSDEALKELRDKHPFEWYMELSDKCEC